MDKKWYKGKRILLLAPEFYDYYKDIKRELERRESEVDVILDNFADKDIFYRLFWIKNDKLRYKYSQNYYIKRINLLDKDYDVILMIRGTAIDRNIIKLLKTRYKKAKLIMYQWDSIDNNKSCLEIAKYFDYAFTFDRNDADYLGWNYRPLFFGDEVRINDVNRKYDFALVGTLYYKRALLLKKVKEFSDRYGYSLFDYLVSPRLVFYLHKYIMHDSKYKDISKKEVKFKSLKREDLRETYCDSKILVDYAADNQEGLTMRSIESIGYGCKLITNNKSIMREDIYRFGNIYIYDLDLFDVPKSFIESPYNMVSNDVMHYYSISGWVDDIFKYMD